MFNPYPAFVGLRYTFAKSKNHFISFISLSSMIGLVLGVAVLITVLSVMNGFDRELKQRILGMVPHAVIRGYEPITDWRLVAQEATKHQAVLGAAPFIQAQGMMTGSGQVHGVVINGIVPDVENSVSIVSNHMNSGNIEALEPGSFNIVLGQILASSLRVNIGDKVTVVFPEAAVTPAGVFPRLKRFTVKGIFEVGAELDASLAYAHMEDMAKILRMPGNVHGVRLKVEELFKAPKVAWEIARSIDGQYFAVDWTSTHGNLFNAIKMEKTMMGLLLMLIVAVAAFNIVSTLVMVVTDKQADIAILRTMGAKPREIMAIFVIQGAFIGVVGTVVGTVAGVLLALNVSDIISWLEKILNHQFLSADVYFISYLPSQLQWSDVYVVCGSGLVMSLLATLYPAFRASRVQPAEALRYE